MRLFRVMARGIVPFALRWRMRAALRVWRDRQSGVTFARRRGSGDYPHQVCAYTRPLSCYPGQERAFEGKRHNIDLALRAIDGIVIAAGETFSFWHAAGRPTERVGYRRAAALKRGVLTEDVGGALCLASTLLYNVGLLGGMEIVERRCHSVDSYGDARYFELGRDAAVEYAYIDLRFRNPHAAPLLLRARIAGDTVVAELRSDAPLAVTVEILVDAPTYATGRIRVRATRLVTTADRAWTDVATSAHVAPWLNEARSTERNGADTIVIASSPGAGGDDR